jgi:hypothetical protein
MGVLRWAYAQEVIRLQRSGYVDATADAVVAAILLTACFIALVAMLSYMWKTSPPA